MSEPKIWYTSKMLWINILTVAAMILSFVVDTSMAGGLPLDLDPRWIALALGIINIILRSVTSQPVSRSKPHSDETPPSPPPPPSVGTTGLGTPR